MVAKYADISKRGSNLTDLSAIIECIDNIIKTRIGESPFNREFGSRIEDYLFRPLTFSISRLILSELISSISRWEKRVDVISLTNVSVNKDLRRYDVVLHLQIKGLNKSIELSRSLVPKGEPS